MAPRVQEDLNKQVGSSDAILFSILFSILFLSVRSLFDKLPSLLGRLLSVPLASSVIKLLNTAALSQPIQGKQSGLYLIGEERLIDKDVDSSTSSQVSHTELP